ncbi:MAG TPA: hypothetical protein ACQGQI_03710 [Xylella sp.]
MSFRQVLGEGGSDEAAIGGPEGRRRSGTMEPFHPLGNEIFDASQH